MKSIRTPGIYIVAGALAAALAGCGGGGGSSSTENSGTQVSFSPAQVSATGAKLAYQQFSVVASVTNPPTTPVVVVITADKPVIVPVDTSVQAQPDGTYRATFTIDSSQPVGTYAGNFTLSLCSDAQCSTRYPLRGGTLPYSVTILADPLASVTVNGAHVAQASDFYYPVHVGDTATITTNIAASWPTPGADDGYQVLSSTSTTLTVKFTANSFSTTPILRFYTAGGMSQVGFQFTAP